MGCGHKIILSKNMSYGRTCFSGSYAFRMACVMIAYVLREVRLWWSASLQDGISYNMLCFTGDHVYLRVGIIGGHVLLLEMSYWGMVVMSFLRICIMGGHV